MSKQQLVKKYALSTLAAATLAFSGSAMAAEEEGLISVDASVAVSNIYLFRGLDLGDGDAAISGDITASALGFYGSVWASSGDDDLGTEYDLILGWGFEKDNFAFDINVTNYLYPSCDDGSGGCVGDGVGELSEVIASASVGPFSVTYADNVAGSQGYEYYAAAVELGSFTALVGMADLDDDDNDYTHVDLTYAYNDNLSFTVSQVVDQTAASDADEVDEDMLFVLSYSLPVDLSKL